MLGRFPNHTEDVQRYEKIAKDNQRITEQKLKLERDSAASSAGMFLLSQLNQIYKIFFRFNELSVRSRFFHRRLRLWHAK